MPIYRSLVLGLLCALLMLVATRGPASPASAARADAAPVVVDVSRAALAAAALGPDAVIGARPGEQIRFVDGRPGDAGALVDAWGAVPAGGFVDLELAGRGASRRVLLLVHP